MPLNQLFLLESVVLLFLMWVDDNQHNKNYDSRFKSGSAYSNCKYYCLVCVVPLYECKGKHAIVNVWRPQENFGSQLSSPPWVLHIELKQSVLYNMCIPIY